jgi:hypothetical protein
LKSLILCDGIGEFRNSSKFSEAVCEIMIKSAYKDIDELLNNDKIIKLKESKIEGGTTVLFANTTNNTDLTIEYLGNGGCIQLSGSFAKNQNNLAPYRYNNLINPHISFNGSLTRHLSHNSNNNEHKRGKLILWEEAGKFPGLKTAWQIARPSVEDSGIAFGLMIAYGTGGTLGADYEGLKEMFYEPNVYNVVNMKTKHRGIKEPVVVVNWNPERQMYS